MPAHGHGLPSAPRLAAGPTAQDFVVEGVRFSMAGHWELRVAIVDRDGTDVAVFPVEVGAAARPNRAELWSASEREALRSLTPAKTSKGNRTLAKTAPAPYAFEASSL